MTIFLEFYMALSSKLLLYPKYSQPSPAHPLLNSYYPPSVLLSFHHRSRARANQISRGKEIREGLAESIWAYFSLSSSSFSGAFCSTQTGIYAYANTHPDTFRDIHTYRGQERELPWETEAWVKEGCWQWKGLTHLLASKSLSPPSNALKGTVQQWGAKHSGWSLDPCTCLLWGKGDRLRILCLCQCGYVQKRQET